MQSQDIVAARYCKTVKFIEEPTLKELGCQLKFLSTQLQKLVQHDRDFDLDFSDEDEQCG